MKNSFHNFNVKYLFYRLMKMKKISMLNGMSHKNVLAYLDAHTYPTKSSVQFGGMVDLSMTHVTKMSRGRYFLENVQVI